MKQNPKILKKFFDEFDRENMPKYEVDTYIFILNSMGPEGSSVFDAETVSRALAYGRNTFYRSIRDLKKRGLISTEKRGQDLIISMCDWEYDLSELDHYMTFSRAFFEERMYRVYNLQACDIVVYLRLVAKYESYSRHQNKGYFNIQELTGYGISRRNGVAALRRLNDKGFIRISKKKNEYTGKYYYRIELTDKGLKRRLKDSDPNDNKDKKPKYKKCAFSSYYDNMIRHECHKKKMDYNDKNAAWGAEVCNMLFKVSSGREWKIRNLVKTAIGIMSTRVQAFTAGFFRKIMQNCINSYHCMLGW